MFWITVVRLQKASFIKHIVLLDFHLRSILLSFQHTRHFLLYTYWAPDVWRYSPWICSDSVQTRAYQALLLVLFVFVLKLQWLLVSCNIFTLSYTCASYIWPCTGFGMGTWLWDDQKVLLTNQKLADPWGLSQTHGLWILQSKPYNIS